MTWRNRVIVCENLWQNVQNEVTKKVSGCDVAGTTLQKMADWVLSNDTRGNEVTKQLAWVMTWQERGDEIAD
jgi:hypothetical protein